MTAAVQLHPMGQGDPIERRIRLFVQTELERIPDAERLVVYHLGQQPEKIFSVEPGPKDKKLPAEVAETLSKEIFGVARDHQESFGTRQRYRLVSEEKDGSERKPCFFGFGQSTAKEDGGKPEGPPLPDNTPALALYKQLFDQNNKLSNLITEVMPQMMQQQSRQIEILAGENRRMVKNMYETEALKQELLNQKHERDILLMREEISIKGRDEVKRKLFEEIFPLVKKHVLKRYLSDDEASKKVLGEAKEKILNAAEDGQVSEEQLKIAEVQAVFREIMKIVGRPEVESSLPVEHRGLIDDLVGVGKVTSLAGIKEKAQTFYVASDQGKREAWQEKLIADGKASLLGWLVSFLEES